MALQESAATISFCCTAAALIADMSSGLAQPAASVVAAHTFPAMQVSISAVAPDFTSLRIVAPLGWSQNAANFCEFHNKCKVLADIDYNTAWPYSPAQFAASLSVP